MPASCVLCAFKRKNVTKCRVQPKTWLVLLSRQLVPWILSLLLIKVWLVCVCAMLKVQPGAVFYNAAVAAVWCSFHCSTLADAHARAPEAIWQVWRSPYQSWTVMGGDGSIFKKIMRLSSVIFKSFQDKLLHQEPPFSLPKCAKTHLRQSRRAKIFRG